VPDVAQSTGLCVACYPLLTPRSRLARAAAHDLLQVINPARERIEPDVRGDPGQHLIAREEDPLLLEKG